MNWLRLENDTFVWVNSRSALLYNPATGQHLLWRVDSPEAESFFRSMADPNNLGCIIINENSPMIDEKHHIIRKITSLNLGRVVQTNEPPVSYPPVLNLQSDPFRMKNNENVREDLYWNTYLKEVVFYLTGSLSANDITIQEIYPLNGDTPLPINPALHFLDECLRIGVDSISICIKPGLHPSESRLLDVLRSIPVKKRLYIKANDITITDLRRFGVFDEIIVLYHKDYEPETNTFIYDDSSVSIKKKYLIDNEKDYSFYNEIYQGDETISAYPIFTGNNQQFFCDNVFLSHSEILGQKLDKRIIFARQRANLNQFGVLSVLPDGNVYSNMLERPIGTIKEPIQSIIGAEMKSKKGWLKTRDTKPCHQCLCKWLCPSPTAYEELMKHPACLEGTELTTEE